MPASQAETNWEVKIKYSGEWSGSAGGTTSASYEGVGSETLTISVHRAEKASEEGIGVAD